MATVPEKSLASIVRKLTSQSRWTLFATDDLPEPTDFTEELAAIIKNLGPITVFKDVDNPDLWEGPAYSISADACVICHNSLWGPGCRPLRSLDAAILVMLARLREWQGCTVVVAKKGFATPYGPVTPEKWARVMFFNCVDIVGLRGGVL